MLLLRDVVAKQGRHAVELRLRKRFVTGEPPRDQLLVPLLYGLAMLLPRKQRFCASSVFQALLGNGGM